MRIHFPKQDFHKYVLNWTGLNSIKCNISICIMMQKKSLENIVVFLNCTLQILVTHFHLQFIVSFYRVTSWLHFWHKNNSGIYISTCKFWLAQCSSFLYISSFLAAVFQYKNEVTITKFKAWLPVSKKKIVAFHLLLNMVSNMDGKYILQNRLWTYIWEQTQREIFQNITWFIIRHYISLF